MLNLTKNYRNVNLTHLFFSPIIILAGGKNELIQQQNNYNSKNQQEELNRHTEENRQPWAFEGLTLTNSKRRKSKPQ